MKSKLIPCLALLLGAMTIISTPVAQSQPLPALRVIVIPSATNVHIWEPFELKLRVENETENVQTIRVMSCSWQDEWQCGNTNLAMGVSECQKNVVVDMGLAPSAGYEKVLNTYIRNLIPNKELSFRMGFTSIGSTNTLWSNEVKLHIFPPRTFPPDTWTHGGKYYRDRNHDGKIDWEVSGDTWQGHPPAHPWYITHSNGTVHIRGDEWTGRGVDIYKVDTNYDGYYDLEYGAGGTDSQIQWTKPIHERVPDVGNDFVPVEKEWWMDQWTESNLGNVLKGIEKQIPELKATGITAGPPLPSGGWQGEDNGTARFALNTQGVMDVAIGRYASPSEAQQAARESMMTRQVMPSSKQNYKGAILYRYAYGGVAICQAADYDIEIDGRDPSLMMKVLDAILGQLDYHRDVRSGKAASATAVKLKFVRVDSEETNNENGRGQNAVDGNPNTYWHTQWHTNSPGLPHEIILELDPPSIINGFTYLPRQDESDHGTIKDYEFYASNDGTNFGEPISKGSFEPGKEEKIETFTPIKCRFIKLKAISEINGLPWTCAAEIRVIQPSEDTGPKDYWRGDIGGSPEPHDAGKPDAIDSFVGASLANGGLWLNGIQGMDTSADSPQEAVSETLRNTHFRSGMMTSYRILDMRKVRIGELGVYTTALADTNLGEMIVIMSESSRPGYWWQRIYYAYPPFNRLD